MFSEQSSKIKRNYGVYKTLFFLTFLVNTINGYAQTDTSSFQVESKLKTTLNIGTYLDLFYTYDFNKPITDKRVPYMVNHNRHNEFNLNEGVIVVSLENNRFHAKFVMQAGTYANDNYFLEDDQDMNVINQAGVGLALTKNGRLWFDIGILDSHIGFESIFMMDDITLTRSLMVENIPYYLTGAKLTYTFNKKWELLVMINNGWQRIKRVQGNSLLSWSTALTYAPNKKLKVGWNTFTGTDDPDSTRRMRYFNELYALYTINSKWGVHGGFDYGYQQISKGSSQYYQWFIASLLAQYSIDSHWNIGVRGEYAIDKHGVIISNPTPNEFILWGMSGNLDYKPYKNVLARVEGRYWFSENDIFVKGDNYVSNDVFITFSLLIQFGKSFKF